MAKVVFRIIPLVFIMFALDGAAVDKLLINPYISAKGVHTLTAPSWLKTRPIYLNLVNEGVKEDALIAAESDVAEKVLLQYTHAYDGELKTLRPLQDQRIPLPPQAIVRLQKGGLHLMLIGLKRPLKLGREIPLKLIFEKSDPIYTRVIIQKQPD